MRRVTVDTNIFISAVFWRGIPALVIAVFQAQRAVLVLSDDILNELERKLHHRRFAARLVETGLTVEGIVSTIRDLAEIVPPADVPNDAVRDPNDRMILACAIAGNADLIVSGDKDLLIMEAYQTIPILTPSAFLEMLNPLETASSDPAPEG
jgi:putative PIN family toxin of toxin-antitoxin system